MGSESKVLNEPAFTGREQELQQLTLRLDSTIKGKGKTVFVSGEAGVGKSRLIDEFVMIAKNQGAVTLKGRCLSNAAVPYFPFFEAFSTYFSELNQDAGNNNSLSPPAADTELTGTGVISWLLGPVQPGQQSQSLSPQVWKDHTFAAVINTLSLISKERAVVLFIEDVHWADSASLSLLHYLARLVGSKKIAVLATFRSDELVSDLEGHTSPLTEVLRLMRREDLFTEIQLTSLRKENVSKMAENVMGGRVHSELVEKLAKESSGNPLFIVESLRMLSERGSIIKDNNEWRLTVDTISIPSKIKDIILSRISRLKHSQRKILDAASIIGEKFNIELISSVLGQDHLEVLDALNVIAQSTSLICVEEDSFRFDHAKSREVIYGEIPLPLRKGYHLRVANKLESAKQQGRLPYSDIAYHYDRAGDKEKAAKNSLFAGQDALSRWSNQQAIDHFGYVVQNISDIPSNEEIRRVALEGLGDAFYAHNMFEDAFKIFIGIAEHDPDRLNVRAYRKAMDALFRKGDSDRLMELVKKVEPYVVTDRIENARILWSKARAEAYLADWGASLKDHEEALHVFEEEYSIPDVAQLLCGTGSTYSESGFHDKALNPILRSIAIFRELKDEEGELNASQIAATAFAFAGLFEESREIWHDVLEISKKLGHYTNMAFAHFSLGAGSEQRENFDDAIFHSLKAIEYSEKTDNKFYQSAAYGSLARQYAHLGDFQHVEEYLAKLKSARANAALVSGQWFVFFISFAEAVIFAAKGKWKEADKYFEKTFDSLKAMRNPLVWEARVRTQYIWSLKMQGRTEEEEVQLQKIRLLRKSVDNSYGNANLQASLTGQRSVKVNEEFDIRLDLVNVSRKPSFLVSVKRMLLDDFEVLSLPPWCAIKCGVIEANNKEIGAFQVETIKLSIRSSTAGIFTPTPQVVYTDNLGKTRTFNVRPITITVNPPPTKERVLGKISSGTPDLDQLLLGGIPENYAVVLVAPSSDERSLLIKRFLDAGVANRETTFYLTTQTPNAQAMAKEISPDLYLFLCSPRTDASYQDIPNVFRVKGVESLTEIDISLAKAFRSLDPNPAIPRRICIELVSDVLLQHGALVTRKWLNGLIPELRARGFTILAIVDPSMHKLEEIQAIIGLFEGEIRVTEKETVKGTEKILKIRKLYNQKYLENELILTK